MKTFRKFRKSVKALSPVVASIILIAVTVAVSIAVAAWMGALSVGFMSNEQVSITYVDFGATPGTTVTLNVTNSNSNTVVITSAVVNDVAVAITGGSVQMSGNTHDNQVELTLTADWVPGYTYNFRLTSQKGNTFPYTAVAPGP